MSCQKYSFLIKVRCQFWADGWRMDPASIQVRLVNDEIQLQVRTSYTSSMKYVAVITRSGQQYPVRMYTHHMVRRGFLLLLDRCVG
jgi:hypothetical protein